MNAGPTSGSGDADAPEPRRGRIERILPIRLVGQGRRPTWQRARVRRIFSAALVAAAAWLAMSAFLPRTPPRGIPIVVVARDLMPGHVLTSSDLAVADWPRDLGPVGAVALALSQIPGRSSARHWVRGCHAARRSRPPEFAGLGC